MELDWRTNSVAHRPLMDMFWSVLIYTWANLGFYTLILLAGLQSIPKDLYEGWNGWHIRSKSFLENYTTITYASFVVTVLSLLKAFQAFEELFALQVGWISCFLYIWNRRFRGQKTTLVFNKVMASLLVALLLILLSLLQFYLTRRQVKLWQRFSIFCHELMENRLSFVDWIAYAYLSIRILIIFLSVLWLLLNSVKSQFLLQKLDTNVLPLDYDIGLLATVLTWR